MPRDYRKEYDNYQGKPTQIKRRASRNTARRKVLKGKKSTKDVDHKDRNPMNNSRKNLRLVTKGRNRSRNA
jgi:hypothetical protein